MRSKVPNLQPLPIFSIAFHRKVDAARFANRRRPGASVNNSVRFSVLWRINVALADVTILLLLRKTKALLSRSSGRAPTC